MRALDYMFNYNSPSLVFGFLPIPSFPKWDNDRKVSCEQTLLKGEGPRTSWTRELTDNGELILVRQLLHLLYKH